MSFTVISFEAELLVKILLGSRCNILVRLEPCFDIQSRQIILNNSQKETRMSSCVNARGIPLRHVASAHSAALSPGVPPSRVGSKVGTSSKAGTPPQPG